MITGLTVADDRDEMKKVVKKIAEKLKVTLEENEISCKRIGKEENKLKVSFDQYEKKEEIMKAKRNKNLTSDQFGSGEKKYIFINHEMSYESQLLSKTARDFKKEAKYRYVWYSDGKIFLKKEEGSAVIHVKTEKSLEKLNRKSNADQKN